MQENDTITINGSEEYKVESVITTPTPGHYKLSDQKPAPLVTFAETDYTKAEKDLKRLTKMENKITPAYKFEDKNGEIITVSAPLRILESVQETAKEKLGENYISITK